jgi:hypothetical protein
VLLAMIASAVVLGTACSSHSHATSSRPPARLELAPVSGRTHPPCDETSVLEPGGHNCLVLEKTVATKSDVTDATVMYISNQAAWTVALTLDSAAIRRIAQAARRTQRLFPAPTELAVIVDGRVVTVIPAGGSGQTLLIGSQRETRAQAIALATSITGRVPSVQGGPNDEELALADHWHVALGVDDCGTWVPNWAWPPGNVSDASAVGAGAPARAGSHGRAYAGLHSHGDGLIHLEPLTTDETGAHATLGLYFRYGGWKLSADAITFAGVHERNGSRCDGKPGVLRWAVNGTEMHGNPADYRLRDRDTVELVFTTVGAPMPPKSAVPSYATLRQILGLTGSARRPAECGRWMWRCGSTTRTCGSARPTCCAG